MLIVINNVQKYLSEVWGMFETHYVGPTTFYEQLFKLVELVTSILSAITKN